MYLVICNKRYFLNESDLTISQDFFKSTLKLNSFTISGTGCPFSY